MKHSTEYKAFISGVQYILCLLQDKYPDTAARLIQDISGELLEDMQELTEQEGDNK
jgi:hypothetical protein